MLGWAGGVEEEKQLTWHKEPEAKKKVWIGRTAGLVGAEISWFLSSGVQRFLTDLITHRFSATMQPRK